jgi:hypothetical protein
VNAAEPLVEELPLLADPGVVLYPGFIQTLQLSPESLAFAPPLDKDTVVAIFDELESVKAPHFDAATGPIGTAVRVLESSQSTEGVAFKVAGLRRVRLEGLVTTEPYKTGRVVELKEGELDGSAFALAARLRVSIHEVLGPHLPAPNPLLASTREFSPGTLADAMAIRLTQLPLPHRWFLKELNPATRLAWIVNWLEVSGDHDEQFRLRSKSAWLNRAYALVARVEGGWVLHVALSANEALVRVEKQVSPFNSREVRRYAGSLDLVEADVSTVRSAESTTTFFLYVPGRETLPRIFARRFSAQIQVTPLTPTTSRVWTGFRRRYNWWFPGALMLGAISVMLVSPFATSFGELAALFAIVSSVSLVIVRSVFVYKLKRFVESDKAAAVEWLRSTPLGPYRALVAP